MSRIEGFYRRAYIGGTFDCLHRGHLNLLQSVRLMAHEVVVSLNTDDFAARYKRRPLMPLADRMSVLEHCTLVDQVIINIGDEDSKVAIVSANVDCIVHGDDWPTDSLMVQMGFDKEWLLNNDLALVTVPYTHYISTSILLERYLNNSETPAKVDENATSCATCGRGVYRTDVDANGNCSEHAVPTGHESVAAN